MDKEWNMERRANRMAYGAVAASVAAALLVLSGCGMDPAPEVRSVDPDTSVTDEPAQLDRAPEQQFPQSEPGSPSTQPDIGGAGEAGEGIDVEPQGGAGAGAGEGQ